METTDNKRFGASGINREMFTDCLGGVFNMENVSDSNMPNTVVVLEWTLYLIRITKNKK
jgi:hypothetical protein